MNFSLGYKIRPAYVLALAFLLIGFTKLSRLFGMIIISLLSILSALYLPAAMTYGSPSVNTIAAIRYTSLTESIEFIKMIPASTILFILFILCTGVYCNIISREIKNLDSKPVLYCTLIAIIIISFRPLNAYVNNAEFSYHSIDFIPVRFIADIFYADQIVNDEEDASTQLLITQDDWSPSVNKAKYNTYILVVGESVRKDYLNAFGYNIQNTPFLSKSPGKFFKNYFSASFSTVLSLTSTFLPRANGKIEYNNSIIRLARKAGFKTFWLSNQGRFGVHDGPIANIGRQADVSYFIKNGDSEDEHFYPDTALIPEIEKAVSDRTEKKLIVIHLMGSHPAACNRTNGNYDFYYKSKDISCYIQSIKDTDLMLKKITEIASSAGERWSMLFFADHGLRQYNKNNSDVYMEHDDKYIQSFTPPLVIINYDDAQRLMISSERSGLGFIPIFAQWLGIIDKRIEKNCNFLAEEKCTDSIFVIDNNQKMRNIETLCSDPAM